MSHLDSCVHLCQRNVKSYDTRVSEQNRERMRRPYWKLSNSIGYLLRIARN
jgi:hypothetical protein